MRGPGWIVGTYYDPANHILHTLLTSWSVRWLDFDAFALRLPALLFSIASIVPVYGLARCAAGSRIAFYAGLCAAILPVMVLEGVEARGYAMMIFFSAAASWALVSAWRDPRPWKWLIYALCCALGVWAHFTTAFIALGHGAWAAWRLVRHRERALFACCASALVLGAVLSLTLCAPILPQLLEIRATFAAVEGDEPRLLGPEGWHALLQLGGSWSWWAAIAGLWLVVHGFWHSRGNGTRRGALALTLTGLPLFLVTVALAGSWMYARFTLFALPGACLAMAIGLDGLWKWQRPAGAAAVIHIIAASVADLAARPPKQPLREAVAYVRAAARPGDRIVAVGLAHRVLEVYAGDLNVMYSLRHGADLDQALAGAQPQWVILYYPRSVRQETYELLRDGGFIESHPFRGWVDWDNGDVIVYRGPPAPP
jgi:4-amino-4-deoxy-L-arabinose transferase-like glycosyltransferase